MDTLAIRRDGALGSSSLETGHGQACSACSLAKLCLPMGLSPDDLERMDSIITRSPSMSEGEHLFRTGDPFKTIYAVRAGCYKSYTVDSEGREHVVGFHLPGELLGLDGIYTGRHHCNAMALDTAGVCILPFRELDKLAGEIDALRARIFRLMSKDIADAGALAGDFTAEERIAAFLTGLSRRFQRRGYSPAEFNLSMSRRDIANYLRLTPETVSRVFARLAKAKLIVVKQREMRLLDLPRLHALGHCLGEMQA